MPRSIAPDLLLYRISIRFLFAMMGARSAAMLFVSRNDPLHQRMADNVTFREFDDSNAFGVAQNAMCFEQSGLFVRGQIDLGLVPGDNCFRIDAQPSQEH